MLPKWFIWVILTMVAIVVLVFGWWLFPRVVGLYYQVRGGRLLEEAIQVASDIQPDDILCAVEPTSDETARALAEKAIDLLEKSVSNNPNLAQGYLLLGRANCLVGEAHEAVKSLSDYINIRPNNPIGYIENGFGYISIGMQKSKDGAIESCLFNSSPSDEDNHYINSAGRNFRASGIRSDQIIDLASESFYRGEILRAACYFQLADSVNSQKSNEIQFIRRLVTALSAPNLSKDKFSELSPVYTLTDSLSIDATKFQWIKPLKVAGQPLSETTSENLKVGVMWGNGSAGVIVKVPDSGKYLITINVQNSLPQPIELEIEHNLGPIKSFSLDKGDLSWQDLESEVYLNEGLNIITISFLNDGKVSELDRNAYINWLNIDRK